MLREGSAEVSRLRVELVNHHRGIEVVLGLQERAWPLNLTSPQQAAWGWTTHSTYQDGSARHELPTPDARTRRPPRLGGSGWEVPLVVGDDQGGAALHCGGKHMAVARVVRHPIDQRLVSRNPGITEVLAQLRDEVRRFVGPAVRSGPRDCELFRR